MKKITLYLSVLLIILVTTNLTPQETNAEKIFALESISQRAFYTMSLNTSSIKVIT